MVLRYHHVVKFTASSDINKKAFKLNQGLQDNLSSAIKYEFRTKIYLTKKLSLVMKSQVSARSQIVGLGFSWKI